MDCTFVFQILRLFSKCVGYSEYESNSGTHPLSSSTELGPRGGKYEMRCKVPQYPVASYDTDVVEFTSRGNYLPSPQCPIKKGADMLKGQGATGVSQCSTRTPYITAS
ncbi:hypothetical protein PCH_Pc22g06510 [Penicillium rubens Wisconsin 54-1255]|uniref:Uncharacterized protein n=1 Tax=Penicillium rubens (strain ATCC 28089 / DSM 1075 / NRRL 1951 / Wisconsin 54-1255) TaxID=500485 RepID=B6HPU1_PENRW|nr:hypothetical protein PCH_Pc22g06510 [Penicillium rubens Wisconsin 54-1255]